MSTGNCNTVASWLDLTANVGSGTWSGTTQTSTGRALLEPGVSCTQGGARNAEATRKIWNVSYTFTLPAGTTSITFTYAFSNRPTTEGNNDDWWVRVLSVACAAPGATAGWGTATAA